MRCKQGDLAFINKALRPANVGKVVTCAEYLGYFIEGEEILPYCIAHGTDHFWKVTSAYQNIEVENGFSSVAYLPDMWLTPITPPPMEGDGEEELLELEDGMEKMA